MAEISIALTCGDYARIMPLATGEVAPKDIALRMILGSRGSWSARAEMLSRAVQDPDVQGGEWSMAQYLYRIDKGDRRFVGLPVFPLRNFTARDLYGLGMVNRVVQDGDLMPAVRALATELLTLPQKAATKTKHFLDGIFIGPRLY